MDARLTILLLPLVLAGCASDAIETPHDVGPDTTTAPQETERFAAEARVWLPPSTPIEPAETRIALPVNASGMTILVELSRGLVAGAEAPVVPSMVMARIVGPDGTILKEYMMGPAAENEATLSATAATAGEHALTLMTQGASDGASLGTYVDYRIVVEVPAGL